MSNNDGEYISKSEIKSAIKSEIDYQFIKEIENNQTSWGESIGSFLSNTANVIGSVIEGIGDYVYNNCDDCDDCDDCEDYVEVEVEYIEPIVQQTIIQPVIEEVHYTEPIVEHYNVVETPAYNPEIYEDVVNTPAYNPEIDEPDVPEYDDVVGDED